MYSSLYDTIRAFFPADQVHFLLLEDLKFQQESFFKAFYAIMTMEPPQSLLGQPLVKNRSPSESELAVIRCLNRFKLFRGDNQIARRERSVFRRIARLFKDESKRLPAFSWDTIEPRRNIEREFALENAGLVARGQFTEEKLRRYNYLLDPPEK